VSPPRGALLINLGTPDAARPREVRRYLRQFLRDPRVIDLPSLRRALLVEGWILPTRPRRTAAAYAKVWSDAGSPLLVHGRALRTALERRLGAGWAVALGMRYGNPSLGDALRRLEERGVREVVALPLFPQYSSAATGSALAALFAEPAAARLRRIRAQSSLALLWNRWGQAESTNRRHEPTGLRAILAPVSDQRSRNSAQAKDHLRAVDY